MSGARCGRDRLPHDALCRPLTGQTHPTTIMLCSCSRRSWTTAACPPGCTRPHGKRSRSTQAGRLFGKRLWPGLPSATTNLRRARGTRVVLWLGGMFTTDKEEPSDWDGVGTRRNADLSKVDPVLIDKADLAARQASAEGQVRRRATSRRRERPAAGVPGILPCSIRTAIRRVLSGLT